VVVTYHFVVFYYAVASLSCWLCVAPLSVLMASIGWLQGMLVPSPVFLRAVTGS